VKPTVVAESPAANALGRPVGTNVTARFSEPVVGVNGASFTLKRGTLGVSSAVTYNASTRTATLIPRANLLRNTVYTAALTANVKDAAGSAVAPMSWKFRTVR
jgi:hypothetical protein